MLPHTDSRPRSASRDTSHHPCSPRLESCEPPPRLSPATTRAACVPAALGRWGPPINTRGNNYGSSPSLWVPCGPTAAEPRHRTRDCATQVPFLSSLPLLSLPHHSSSFPQPAGPGIFWGGALPGPATSVGPLASPSPGAPACLDVPWLAFRLEKKKEKGKKRKKKGKGKGWLVPAQPSPRTRRNSGSITVGRAGADSGTPPLGPAVPTPAPSKANRRGGSQRPHSAAFVPCLLSARGGRRGGRAGTIPHCPRCHRATLLCAEGRASLWGPRLPCPRGKGELLRGLGRGGERGFGNASSGAGLGGGRHPSAFLAFEAQAGVGWVQT